MSEYGSPTFRNNEAMHEFREWSPSSASCEKRLFGRTLPVHAYLGGGATGDIILWRNKQVSGSIFAGATLLWFLFEGMGYHLLTFICHFLMLSLALLFIGSYVAPFVNRTAPKLPEVILPEDLFLMIAHLSIHKINEMYATFRSIASGNDLKKFLQVVAGLWALSVIGSWFSFLTLTYIVFVAVFSLPALYEKYEDQVDDAAKKALVEIYKQYSVLDEKVLSKIPCCPFSHKKHQ